mmetsp:Transcript_25244/g.56056  ORF Transcript_25244/g.56056 Transcript_25244/m.56056 type:complete len:183 (-) Transcript_25244:1480-2028(-)
MQRMHPTNSRGSSSQSFSSKCSSSSMLLHAQTAWMIHHQQLLAAGVGGGNAGGAQVGDAASMQPSEMAGGTITSPPPLGGGQPQPQTVYLPAETLAQYHGKDPAPATMSTSAPKSTITSSTTAKKKRKTIDVAEGERAPQRRFSTAGQDHLHFTSEKSSRIPMTTNAPREGESGRIVFLVIA